MFDVKIHLISLGCVNGTRDVQFDIFTLEFAENDFLARPGIVNQDVPH